ncbi:MAG: ATP-grasp domain-containing protein, partial [Methanospirillum sp.]|nr:ATP-grasp domain-containing protein [Methanospirillum sp.]
MASAWRAGYEVYAADHFRDRDLQQYTTACWKFDELAELPFLIAEICDTYGIDAIIPTSGAENLQNLPAPVLGTDPAIAANFLDKKYTQSFFEKNGIPVPSLVSPGRYPAMLKPTAGSGGWRNTVVNSDSEVAAWKEAFPEVPFLLQEIADGIPASVCCISDGCRARAVAVNRQILRGMGPYKYGFSGSVTPFDHPLKEEMIRYAEQAAGASGCRGVLGIDFIAGAG